MNVTVTNSTVISASDTKGENSADDHQYVWRHSTVLLPRFLSTYPSDGSKGRGGLDQQSALLMVASALQFRYGEFIKATDRLAVAYLEGICGKSLLFAAGFHEQCRSAPISKDFLSCFKKRV